MRHALTVLTAVAILIAASATLAEIPQLISYQGRLTNESGEPISGDYEITFTIYYVDGFGGDAEWAEVHPGITVTDGLFKVLLGSIETLPHDCFANDTVAWLGITIGEDPEMEPKIRLVSVPFAYHALRADTAYVALSGSGVDCGWTLTGNVVHLVDEGNTVRVGSFDGGARVNISDEAGADVDSSTGLGVWTHDVNANKTTAGYFSATGNRGPATGIQAVGTAETVDTVYALNGLATNSGSGVAVGLFGQTDFEGSGDKIGVRGRGAGAGAGNTYGGYFSTAGGMSNTGFKYGVYAYGHNLTASNAYGVYGEAYNPNDGPVVGGYFTTSGNGSGMRFGVAASATANNSSDVFGVNGYSQNDGSGNVYGGSFIASPNGGTGVKRALNANATTHGSESAYGIDIQTSGLGSGTIYGIDVSAVGMSAGEVYGGYFDITSGSSVKSYGLVVEATCDAAGKTYGITSSATNTSTGWTHGGILTATGNNIVTGAAGNAWGTNASFVHGVAGYAQNLGSGPAEAGTFSVSNNGAGTHYGVWAYELAGGSGAAVYASGDFAASGTKSAVVRTSEGTTLMYAMESAEVWFEDFGDGQMVGGVAHINLDPLFLETVAIDAANPMKVFVQLNDDCKGAFVKTSLTGFDVYELQRGSSNASFTYRVVAKRKGYEDERMRVAEIGYDDPNLYPERAEEILDRMLPQREARPDQE